MTVKELRELLSNMPGDLDVLGVSYDKCEHAYQTDVDTIKVLSVKEYESKIPCEKVAIDDGSNKDSVLFISMF